jgi:hypothetical protein
MVLVIRCQTLLEDLWTIWSCWLYVFYEYYYHNPSYSLGSIFYQCIYGFVVSFLFNNVIYVFLFLSLCILTVCLCMIALTKVFPCFFLSCKANARVKPAKTEHGKLLLCCFMYFLCCSMYFCVVLCIVCFLTFSVLFVCICVLNNCHRVATQLQLNISYHISSTDEVILQMGSQNLWPPPHLLATWRPKIQNIFGTTQHPNQPVPDRISSGVQWPLPEENSHLRLAQSLRM